MSDSTTWKTWDEILAGAEPDVEDVAVADGLVAGSLYLSMNLVTKPSSGLIHVVVPESVGDDGVVWRPWHSTSTS